MNKWFQTEKWTDEKMGVITDLLSGLIVSGYSRNEIILPTGEAICIRCDDVIKEEWTGGRFLEARHFLVRPIDNNEPYYDLELSMSEEEPFWGVINDLRDHGPIAYYDEFEELVEGIRRIKDGLPPYEYNLVLARDMGLPENHAYDFDLDNIPVAKTVRITRFGANEKMDR